MLWRKAGLDSREVRAKKEGRERAGLSNCDSVIREACNVKETEAESPEGEENRFKEYHRCGVDRSWKHMGRGEEGQRWGKC